MKAKYYVYPLVLALITVCLIVLFVPTISDSPASADMGPKPSVRVTFKNGPENEKYYATLLSESPNCGPHHAYEPEELSEVTDPEWLAHYAICDIFAGYIDPDGFYFLEFYEICEGSDELAWTYYPPSTFKVLVYFPERETFISSAICKSYAFDSYYTVDLKDGSILETSGSNAAIEVDKSYDYTGEILALAVRIVLTMGIELLIALCFGFRQKKKVLTILITNAFTNVLLNIVLYIFYNQGGMLTYVLLYFMAELLVFVIESIVYALVFGKDEPKASVLKSILYALSANVLSFVAGLVLGVFVPTLF